MTEPNVRLKTSVQTGEFLAFVQLPGEREVKVRFRRKVDRHQWTCEEHGKHRFSTCKHERTAAAAYRNRPNK